MNVDSITKIIQAEMQQVKIPSCTYVVVNPDGIVASGALGFADIREKKGATPQTSYHLFSATKVYTATAVMQLIEAGKLSLDQPFTDVLPEYRSESLETITIRHLLSHHAGLKESLQGAFRAHQAGDFAPDTAEALSHYKLKAARRPGEEVKYLNVNFAILGEIITRQAGQPYVDYVRERILQPLGMQVAFGYTPEMQTDFALGYISSRDPLRFLLWVLMPKLARAIVGKRVDGLVELHPYELDTAAIGGLVGPVMEFAPFMIAHLNRGEGILTPESTWQMQEVVAQGQAGFEAKLGVGLGWKIGEVDGQRFLNHEGSGAGFTTETRLYLKDKIGITLMMNRSGVDVHHAAHRICEGIRVSG